MGYHFVPHALERLAKWGVTVAEVDAVLADPEMVEAQGAPGTATRRMSADA